MIIQIYTTNNVKNVQKVLAAKLELFMEILCDNKSIPKTFLMYVSYYLESMSEGVTY